MVIWSLTIKKGVFFPLIQVLFKFIDPSYTIKNKEELSSSSSLFQIMIK